MKWRIARKLSIASILMVVLTFLAGSVGLWQVLAIGQAVTTVQKAEEQRAQALEMQASARRLVGAFDHLLRTEDSTLTTKELLPAQSLLNFHLYLLQKSDVEMRMSAPLGELHSANEELRQLVGEVDILARLGQWNKATFVLEYRVRPLNQRIDVLINQLVHIANRNAERATLRVEQAIRRAMFLLAALAVLTTGIAFSWRQVIFRQLGQSIALLRQGVARISGGDLDHVLAIRTGDEIEELANDFNEMARNLQASQTRLEQWGHDLESSVAGRTRELQQSLEEQRRLSTAIREMSTPVVPVHPGVIVMPLVGVIDAPRADQIVAALLRGVEAHDAKVAIIDITGIPVMDSEVAGYLVEASQAARLLGAQIVLVGIKPEVAKSIVGLGVDLTGIVTRSDLQAGIEYALATMGLRVTRNGV